MRREPDTLTCTDEAARLLPWYVSGTLTETDAARVAAHLERCATCCADAAREETTRALLRIPTQVEHTPRAGLRKLLARIDASELAVPAPLVPAAVPPRSARGPVRWLAAAVIVQAGALAAIAGATFFGSNIDTAPRFHTLTSTAPKGARIRILFTPAMTLSELQKLLRANQLTAVGGPTAAGLFTVALRPTVNRPEARDAVLARLRADPRVRFAELVEPDAGTR